MNQIQKLSQKILADRLKLQLGLDIDTDIEYKVLQAMSRQFYNNRLLELARTSASHA